MITNLFSPKSISEMLGFSFRRLRARGARSKGMMRMDGMWTSRGRAGAAEIAWEEARRRTGWSCRNSMGGGYDGGSVAWEEGRDGGARSKGMMRTERLELQK